VNVTRLTSEPREMCEHQGQAQREMRWMQMRTFITLAVRGRYRPGLVSCRDVEFSSRTHRGHGDGRDIAARQQQHGGAGQRCVVRVVVVGK